MREAMEFEGTQNALTMPIKARLDMLTTGIRTPVGIKIFGDDLVKIDAIGQELEGLLRQIPGTSSVYAEREIGGFFVDFIPDRVAIARYGLRVMDVMDIVETAIGGLMVDTTIEGRERYRINVRYPRALREDLGTVRKVLVPVPKPGMQGEFMHVPLGQLGEIKATMGPSMIKNEMGSLTGWVYVDIDTNARDLGGYVDEAKRVVSQKLQLPTGYFLKWTGQYEYLARVRDLMKSVVPVTLLLIFVILLLSFGGLPQALIIMLSTPFACMGAIWLMFAYGYNLSVAAWVGVIALLGIAAQTASIMVVHLNQGFDEWCQAGRLQTKMDLLQFAVERGVSRLRPLLMAVGLNILGLVPIMISTGVGADVAKRIAAPLWGGLITLTITTLLVVPAVYTIWRERSLKALTVRS